VGATVVCELNSGLSGGPNGLMMATANKAKWGWVEGALAASAALAGAIISAMVWWVFSPQQAMWPLPALYLLEVPVVAGLAALAVIGGWPRRAEVTWAAAGMLLGFALLAGFSVGFFYLPCVLFLAIAGVRLDRADWRKLALHLGLAILWAAAQGALMLGAIRMLDPNTQF
jgi:hypothetical protein